MENKKLAAWATVHDKNTSDDCQKFRPKSHRSNEIKWFYLDPEISEVCPKQATYSNCQLCMRKCIGCSLYQKAHIHNERICDVLFEWEWKSVCVSGFFFVHFWSVGTQNITAYAHYQYINSVSHVDFSPNGAGSLREANEKSDPWNPRNPYHTYPLEYTFFSLSRFFIFACFGRLFFISWVFQYFFT